MKKKKEKKSPRGHGYSSPRLQKNPRCHQNISSEIEPQLTSRLTLTAKKSSLSSNISSEIEPIARVSLLFMEGGCSFAIFLFIKKNMFRNEKYGSMVPWICCSSCC